MFIDCIFCIAMNRPGAGARSGEVPAMVLTHRETGEKFLLCKACADMFEQAQARFANPIQN